MSYLKSFDFIQQESDEKLVFFFAHRLADFELILYEKMVKLAIFAKISGHLQIASV